MSAAEHKLITFAYLERRWVPCGRLTLTEDGPTVLGSSFAYGSRYIDRPGAYEIDPVSLSIKDKAAVRGKALFPDNNLVVFGGIRDAAPDAWGRRVIEAKLKVPANALPESTYLVHAGSDRVGALDMRRSLDDEPTSGSGSWKDLQYLLDAARRIDEGLPVPASLEIIFLAGSALGGARPKAAVRDERGVLWLAKFSSSSDRMNVPMIETATLKLAAEAGLSVPPVKFLPMGSQTVMLIRRFDRYWTREGTRISDEAAPSAGASEKRLPLVSALTLLACDEMESPKKSYGQIAAAVRRYCHPDRIRADNRELFMRMIFNIFVSNDDDHLRNHAFILDPQLRGWQLSPLYDVVPRPSIAFERQLHLGVGPEGRSATLDNAFAARELFTLSTTEATEAITQVWQVVREWKTFFERADVPLDQIEKVAPAFRHIDEVASPVLRRALP